MKDPKTKYPLIGAVAGAAIGVTQMAGQRYDYAQSEDVYQSIGFLAGFVLFGAFIGWLSSRRSRPDS